MAENSEPRIEFVPETDESAEVYRIVWGERTWTFWNKYLAEKTWRHLLSEHAAHQERIAVPRTRVARAIREAGKKFHDETYARTDGDVRVAYALDTGGETNDRLVEMLTDAAMTALRGEFR